MQFTLRKLTSARLLAGQAIALAGTVGLFTFIGPFGTYDSLGPINRLGYWCLAMGVNWLVCAAMIMLALHATGNRAWQQRAAMTAAAAVAAAIPETGVVFTAENLFRPGYTDAQTLPTIYFAVVILNLIIGGLAVAAATSPRPEKDPAPTGSGPAPFLDRMPQKIGRDLICLKMADHYVEAFTACGSTLVLMRFADAVTELNDISGLQVHRSYWVALDHVIGAERKDGRIVLHLTGGHDIPVSRSRITAVRAAGIAI